MFELINKYLFVNKTTQYGYRVLSSEENEQLERFYFRRCSFPVSNNGVPVLRLLVPISTDHSWNNIRLRRDIASGLHDNSSCSRYLFCYNSGFGILNAYITNASFSGMAISLLIFFLSLEHYFLIKAFW